MLLNFYKTKLKIINNNIKKIFYWGYFFMNSLAEIGGLDLALQRQIQELIFRIGNKSNCLESCLAVAQLEKMLRKLKMRKWQGFNRFSGRNRDVKYTHLLSAKDLARLFGCKKRNFFLKKSIGKNLPPYAIEMIRKIPELNRIEILKKLCRLTDKNQISIISEIENNPSKLRIILEKYGIVQKKTKSFEHKDPPTGKKAIYIDEDIFNNAKKNYLPGMLSLEEDITHYLGMKNLLPSKTKVNIGKKENDILFSTDGYY